MLARTSLPIYGSPRAIFRGKDEIFIVMNSFPNHLPTSLEAAKIGVKVEPVNHTRKQSQAKN